MTQSFKGWIKRYMVSIEQSRPKYEVENDVYWVCSNSPDLMTEPERGASI